ncbi:MG2 domain-containing protein [Ekhidna sp.]|uniref:alpha-2-macroglobulin family protein n=1 Tax=Ekhidna sp. TaxID=2608089 RepID=UPI003299ED00
MSNSFSHFMSIKNALLTLSSVALLVSCSNKDKVEISYKNFGEEVNTTQNLTIEFSQNIADESKLNLWDSTQYIQFEPEIAGVFNWETPNRLTFSPSEKLPPATTISGTVTKKVLPPDGSFALGDDVSFSFKTTPLSVSKISSYWARLNKESKDTPKVFVELEFNFPVPVSELKSRLELQLGSENVAILMDTKEEYARTVKFYVDQFELKDVTVPVKVTLQPGIRPFGGNQATKEAKQITTNLNSPYNFKVNSVSSNYDGSKGILTIVTSQAPQLKNYEKFIEIKPKLAYDVERKNNGFIITSEAFEVTEKYEVTLKKGIEGEIGGLLKNNYREEFSFGKVQPTIKFASNKTRFLSRKGFKNIKVQILNIPEVEVVVSKLYENNAKSFLASRDYYYDYNSDEYYYGYNYNNTNLQDEVWSKKIKTVELTREGNFSLLNLDFEDKLRDYRGIYVVQVRSTENRWLKDARLVSISDLGIIVKNGENNVHVFINSLDSGEPISNASVALIGTNNQKLQTVNTNQQGVAVLNLEPNLPNGFRPQMVTASLQDDYNLLDFGSTAVQTSRYDVGGKYLTDRVYEGFIFMERDLYRPGETANFAVIVRDRKWGLPGEIPIKINVRTPDGREFINQQKILNSQGSTETSIALPKASLTGNYSITIKTSNDKFLTSQTLKVEEFLPDRIKVDSELDKEEYTSADKKINIDVRAVNFFGPPAADKNYELRMQWTKIGFYPKGFGGYNFNFDKTNTQFYDITKQGTTDSEGKANISVDIPTSFKDNGIIRMTAFVTVFDETGRPVAVINRSNVYTQDVFFGLKSDDYWVKTGDLVKSNLIALDKDGNILDGKKATVKVIKHEYKTVLAKSGSYYRYRSQSYERVIEDKEMVFNGDNTSISFIPDLSGRYEVRIFPPGVNNYVSRSFYAYGYGSTTTNSFEVDNEGEVDIVFDKEKYSPGETAKVLLKTPFSGKVLVTIESNNVLDHFYVQADNRSAQFDLPIKDSYLPNVFVSTTLFKPQKESDIPLTVAHGYSPIKVDKAANKLDIKIEAVEKSKSNQSQTIKISTTPNAMVGLAVVDEGILQVSKYQTPDPYNFFYGKRALGVKSYDVYPYLFPEIAGNLTGGGAGLARELSSRINPMNNDRVKLVSFWNGVKQADSKGNLEYTIDIPQFSGDLRIMAVAFKDQAFGNGQDNMTVADPIVISPGIPRFLSPTDTLIMPVAVSNTTSDQIKADVEVSAGELLNVIGKAKYKESLSAGQETALTYTLYADNNIGSSDIHVKVEDGSSTYSHKTDITIRPNSPLLKITGSGVIKGSKTEEAEIKDSNFIERTVKRKLIVSKSPMVEFTKDLSYLLRYPYGCLEQTTSQGFPLLYYRNITSSVLSKDDLEVKNANYIVNEAIKRLYLMQLYNGGFTYWPGQGRESFWGSVYAIHFLVEAQRAGYNVDGNVLSKGLDYLAKKANEKKVIDYYYTYTQKRAIYPRANIYSLYVLALVGQPQVSTMNFYLSKTEYLTSDSKYLLSAAYVLSGDPSRSGELIGAQFKSESQIRSTGGSFYSPIRDEALALTALLDVDPTNSEIPVMAKNISEALKSRRWFSTQERAFSLIALGRIAREAEKTSINAEIAANGKTIGSYKNTKEPLELSGEDVKGKVSINTSGEGTLYYFWESEGISKDGSYVQEDKYIRVRRTYYHENGAIANLSNIKQNDRLIVKLSLSKTFNSNIENVVVTDMLPGCFEVENPRFGQLPAFRWIRDASRPDYSDFRDDRVHLFTDLNYSNTRNYYYMVRAVSKGTYNLGPVAADAMYNNEYHSYHGAGKVVVK